MDSKGATVIIGDEAFLSFDDMAFS